MPDHEARVPERVQQRPEKALVLIAERAVEDDEQIDVGMQAEMASPVAAERGNDDTAVRRRAHQPPAAGSAHPGVRNSARAQR